MSLALQGSTTSVSLSTGDVEIGAVEIKNSTDDTRATVGANGLNVDVKALPANASVNLAQVNGGTVVTGNGTVAGAQRVAIASDNQPVPSRSMGIYHATAPTLSDGTENDVNLDVNGNTNVNNGTLLAGEDLTNNVSQVIQKPIAVSTYSWSRFQNLGANATLNVKNTTGNVFALHCHNLNVADRYIQLHNTTTTPAGGAVPLFTFRVPASGDTQIDAAFFGAGGNNFSNGIAFAFSTTEGTYTAGAAADQNTHIQFI